MTAPVFDRNAYPSDVLARAAAGWKKLHDDERDSVIAATLVATDLARLGAPAEVLGAAARVIEDEVRHVEVCATVLRAYGGDCAAPAIETTRASLGPDESIDARCARTLVAGFGVGEAMSAAGFAKAREVSGEDLVRWAYTELLRDEARHGGFGIDAGRWVIRDWDAARRQTLWRYCVAEMEGIEKRLGGPVDDAMLASESRIRDLPTFERLGLLRRSVTCRASTAAITRWVIPRLGALGVLPKVESQTSRT